MRTFLQFCTVAKVTKLACVCSECTVPAAGARENSLAHGRCFKWRRRGRFTQDCQEVQTSCASSTSSAAFVINYSLICVQRPAKTPFFWATGMQKSMAWIIALILFLFSSNAPARAGEERWLREHADDSVVLSGAVNWVVSDSDRAVLALNMTLADVERDFYKVLGYPPLYVSLDNTVDPLLPPASITSVYFGTPSNMPYVSELLDITTCLDGPESHCLRLVKDPRDPTGRALALVAIGETTRGAIYAAYSFSELILGVDPLYHFSDIQPEFKGVVRLSANLSYVFQEPVFQYRVLFPNDEDLLGGFKPDPMGESVFTVTAFDWFYETALRLKANGVLAGTVPYPDEKSVTQACRRGLVVADHHFNLLGLNTYRWPGEMFHEWDWRLYPGAMSYAWRASAQSMSRLDDVLWSVGYRALGDYAAPCEGCSDATKGRLISEAIANQTEWIASLNPHRPQQHMTYMWDEALGYLRSGDLIIPNDVSLLLTDSGAGNIGGLDEFAHLAEGVYTHVAMHNGWTNQLVEMVPPSRHFTQLAEFLQRCKKAKYIILNTSDLRPVLLTAEGVLRFVWNPHSPLLNASSPQEAQEKYIQWWSARQFAVNTSTAAEIARLYDAYFQIPFVADGIADEHLSGLTATLAYEFSTEISEPGGNVSQALLAKARTAIPPEWLAATQSVHEQSLSLFSKLTNEQLLSADRANFFQAHIMAQHATLRYGCEALSAVAQSIVEYENSPQESHDKLQSALSALDSLFSAQRAAETGHWRGLFFHSRLSDFHRTRTCVRRALSAVSSSSRPPKALSPVRSSAHYTFTAYQFAHQPNFPLFYSNPEWRMDSYVRVSCTNNASCWNNATGGFFHEAAHVTMKLLLSDATIHFTTDGTTPYKQSPTYSSPLNFTETTHLKACAVTADGVAMEVVTDVTYWKV